MGVDGTSFLCEADTQQSSPEEINEASEQDECECEDEGSEWESMDEGLGDSDSESGDDDDDEDGSRRDEEEDAHPREMKAGSGRLTSWLSRLAILGESGYSLLASASLFLLAVGLRCWLATSGNNIGAGVGAGTTQQYPAATSPPVDGETLYRSLGPVPVIDPPVMYELSDPAFIINETLHESYDRDGVIAFRGLISEDLLDELDRESRQVLSEMDEKGKLSRKGTYGKQFHAVQHQLALRNPPSPSMEGGLDNNLGVTAFLNVSLFSQVPKVAAALMQITGDTGGENENLRLIRDIFLTKDADQYVCGWHVDDFGFWPTTADSPGINAWVALDDMPLDTGGGFALAVGSHVAPWRMDAHRAIGATTTAPKNGFTSALDMFVNRTGGGTCNLETEAPHLHRRMEETMRVYELKRGDVIFHHRWLFHRTVAMDQSRMPETPPMVYRRYSLRYGPGSSVIPPGFSTETSVLWDEANGGRTADRVSQLDGPWYPQAFPTVIEDELRGLRGLMENKMPVAEERKAERLQEIQPYLKQIAQKQLQKQETVDQDDWCVQRLAD